MSRPTAEMPPSGQTGPGARSALAFLVALTLMSIIANGYALDIRECMTLLLNVLDSSRLRNDWFVNANSGWNIRSGFSWLMVGPASALGIDAAYVLVYLVGLGALSAAIYTATLTVGRTSGAGLLAAFIGLHNTMGSPAASQLNVLVLVPSWLAFSLVLLAAASLLRGRWTLALILIALAGLLHPLVGPEAGLLLIGAFYGASGPAERLQIRRRCWVVGVAVCFPAMLGMFIKQGGVPVVDQSAVRHILTELREPWHHLPFMWGFQWLQCGVFALLVATARKREGAIQFLDWLIVGIVVFCAFVMLGFVVRPLAAIVILQPFRMFVLFQFAGAMYLGSFLWPLLQAQGWRQRLTGSALLAGIVVAPRMTVGGLIVLGGAILLLALLHPRWTKRDAVEPPPRPWILIAASVAGIAFVAAPTVAYLVARGRPHAASCVVAMCVTGALLAVGLPRHPTSLEIPRLATAAVLSLAVTLFLMGAWIESTLPGPVGALQRAARKVVRPHRPYGDDFGHLALWVRENTPRDAVFVTPPHIAGFRALAERAIVADFSAVPYGDANIVAWLDRIDDLAGGRRLPLGYAYSEQLRVAYGALDSDSLRRLASKYQASYVVTERRQAVDLVPVYENTRYRVYAVADRSSSPWLSHPPEASGSKP